MTPSLYKLYRVSNEDGRILNLVDVYTDLKTAKVNANRMATIWEADLSSSYNVLLNTDILVYCGVAYQPGEIKQKGN